MAFFVSLWYLHKIPFDICSDIWPCVLTERTGTFLCNLSPRQINLFSLHFFMELIWLLTDEHQKLKTVSVKLYHYVTNFKIDTKFDWTANLVGSRNSQMKFHHQAKANHLPFTTLCYYNFGTNHNILQLVQILSVLKTFNLLSKISQSAQLLWSICISNTIFKHTCNISPY